MRKLGKLIFLCFMFLLAVNVNGQEKLLLKMNDTLHIQSEIKNKIIGNFESNIINPNEFIYKEKDFLKLRAKLYTPFIEETQKPLVTLTPQNILSPLYSQYMEEQKNKTWQYILGTVQAGAVGYLAYKHIKKYGFK